MKETPMDGFKKITAALTGAFATPFMLPPNQAEQSQYVLIAYIIVQGLIDLIKAWRAA